MLLEQVKLSQPRRDQLLHQALGQRLVDREVQRPLRHVVPGQVVTKGRQHGAAVGQVAQMVFERSESGHRLAVELERRHSVRDALLRLGHDFEDRSSQCLQRASLRLVERREVAIDLSFGHGVECLTRSSRASSNRDRRSYGV
jgi:hypothetical protein